MSKTNFKYSNKKNSFRFNGQPVPGSPFSCKVNPGNTQPKIPVSGSGIELSPVGFPAEIKIDGLSGIF